MQIIHRAGRVHSNVDPISRLRCRIPDSSNPNIDKMTAVDLHGKEIDPLRNMFEELSDHFEEKLLTVATQYVESMGVQTGMENGTNRGKYSGREWGNKCTLRCWHQITTS